MHKLGQLSKEPLTQQHREPCPFCGSMRIFAELRGNVWIAHCADCLASGPTGAVMPLGAIDKWNRRIHIDYDTVAS